MINKKNEDNKTQQVYGSSFEKFLDPSLYGCSER